MKDVLFIRADENEKIGSGHVMRSLTIAESFRDSGFECVFICSAPVNGELFRKKGFPVIEAEYPYDSKTRREAEDICRLMLGRGAGFILVDSYYVDNEYLSILRSCAKLICINSTRDRLVTDYLINENIACDKAYFKELYSGYGAKLLLGAEYTPIRSEFCNRPYKLKEDVKQVLVTTGGSDRYNFMTRFLKGIIGNGGYPDLEFVFISGAHNVYYELLAKEAEKKENVKVINNAGNMAELMQESDMAVSTGGTTVLELSALGVPTIGIATADDQEAGLSFMHRSGMICCAGKITEIEFWDNIFMYFENVCKDRGLRQQLSTVSRGYIDGRGADRICHQIING